jgi:hypothetical protein
MIEIGDVTIAAIGGDTRNLAIGRCLHGVACPLDAKANLAVLQCSAVELTKAVA